MRHSAEDVLVAGLRLRFGREVVETRLHVPPSAVSSAAVVLLLAEDASPDGTDPLGPGLSAGADLVVVRVPAGAHFLAALQWVEDHAHELGGRPDRLMVAGRGVSGAHAAWLAIAALVGGPSDGSPVVPNGWTSRYAARRVAWHILEHTWEMQD